PRRPPPRPVPYTTLFRSAERVGRSAQTRGTTRVADLRPGGEEDVPQALPADHFRIKAPRDFGRGRDDERVDPNFLPVEDRGGRLDRKSTRLNSRHQIIAD